MTGKNKSLRWTRVLVGGYDISGDARTFNTLLNNWDEADLTGISNAVRNGLPGSARRTGAQGLQALLNDTASSGAHAILKSANHSDRLSVLFGGGAEPAAGDAAYLLRSIQLSDPRGFDALAAVLTADFFPDASQFDASAEDPLGLVLHPATSLAATTNGASIDNGAATTKGAHANLHVLASSGGTCAFTVEHSVNGIAWATLLTFTINGSAITSEAQAASGTVNQYTRFVATRTSGTVTPVCVLARN